MNMEGIGGFLERYKNFTTPPLAAARALKRAILEVVGIEIPEGAITVKNMTASVSSSGIEKTEVLLNKQAILSRAARETMGAVRDIR